MNEPRGVAAFVLAAGLGVRLRPLTDERPKACVPILGRPVVAHVLDRLRAAGFTQAVMNTHHLAENLEREVEIHRRDLRVVYSREPQLLGVGGGLKKAESLLDAETILIHNSDIVTDLEIRGLLRHHRMSNALVTLAVSPSHEPKCLDVGPDGSVRGFRGGNSLFTGVHVVQREVLSWIPPGPGSIIEVYDRLLASGRRIETFSRKQLFWADIGTPEAYLKCHGDILATNGAGLTADGNWMGKAQFGASTSFVDKGAMVEGFLCAGKRSRIAKGAVVRDSILWEDVEVLPGSRVERCIVLDGVRLEGAIADSIISRSGTVALQRAAAQHRGKHG
jgi:mannose-1-phosphate guanylyltransferase